MSVDYSLKISTWSVQLIFYNPVHQFQKHGFENNAFKYWERDKNLYPRLTLIFFPWIKEINVYAVA